MSSNASFSIPTLSPIKIGQYVRNRRTDNHLSQKELGDLAGVGTRFVSELERGKPTLRIDAVNKVLSVFGKMLDCVDAPRERLTDE
jgi:y4mF family transcriptional regulator